MSEGVVEKDSEEFICESLAPYLPKELPKESCMDIANNTWQEALTQCDPLGPHPFPDAAKEYICKVLQNDQVKLKIQGEVCYAAEKIGLPKEECALGMSLVWMKVAEKCRPSTSIKRVKGIPDDIEKDVKEFLCSEMKNGTKKYEAINTVCEWVKSKFEWIPIYVCSTAIAMEWDSWLENCKTPFTGFPIPSGAEAAKIVCGFMRKSENQQMVDEKICNVLSKYDVFSKDDCMLGMKLLWGNVLEKCPPEEAIVV